MYMLPVSLSNARPIGSSHENLKGKAVPKLRHCDEEGTSPGSHQMELVHRRYQTIATFQVSWDKQKQLEIGSPTSNQPCAMKGFIGGNQYLQLSLKPTRSLQCHNYHAASFWTNYSFWIVFKDLHLEHIAVIQTRGDQEVWVSCLRLSKQETRLHNRGYNSALLK